MPPEEVVAATPTPEVDESWVNLAEVRQERAKEQAPPATTEEAVKNAPVTEAGKPAEEEEEVEGTDKDGRPAKVKVKGGFQRKIDKLTKDKSELERTVADLQARQAALAETKPEVKVEAKAEGDPEPKEEDFKDYKEFAKSLARYVTRQELKADRESSEKATQAETKKQGDVKAKEKFDKYLAGLKELRAADPELESAIATFEVPNYIHHRLITMPDGPKVAQALAKNKEVMERIRQLNDEARVRGDNDFSDAYDEFAVFARSLKTTSSPVKPEKPVSQAPRPITPVGGGAGPSEVDLDKVDSIAEYRRLKASGRA
jgi:hypothetical protein